MPEMKKLLVLTALLATPAVTMADGVDPCVETKRPPKKKRPPPKKPTQPVKCDCVGQPGPEGPAGPKGDKGDPGGMSVFVYDPGSLSTDVFVGLGVMGTVQAPHGDWAWGPALRLSTRAYDKELGFNLGWAGLLDGTVGDESGYLAELSISDNDAFTDHLGLTGGIYLGEIDGSSSNGDIDGSYRAVTVAVSYKRPLGPLGLRAELGPTAAWLEDDAEGDQFAVGLQGSLFVGGTL